MVFMLGLLLSLASQGLAEPINSVNALNGLGSFDGTFTYTPTNVHSAMLKITLTNTSPTANGGYITAFVFNNPSDWITNASLTSTNSHFVLLGKHPFHNGIKAPPFGIFDIGASISNRFLGKGKPSNGIGVGDAATFTFSLTGNHLDELSSLDFFSTLSSSASKGHGPEPFLARYRGFIHGGSDKVPGELTVNVPPPTVTISSAPEPTSLALVGAALCCFAVRQCRQKWHKRR
jgi:hypothetical protein